MSFLGNNLVLPFRTDTAEDNVTLELYRPKGSPSSPAAEDSRDISTFDPRNDTYTVESSSSNNNSIAGSRGAEYEPPLDPALPRGPPATDQSIVPQLLIDHYVSMIDPSRAQTVDSEIARHCAFSLPAVALTLGRYNWPLLRDTYEALATDMQWKVRRTLASSIHELGVILGRETSGRDLIPIFNGFLKDLDEVRQGLLKHLADFMELLEPDRRREYLPKLTEFLKMDNERNWRFRQELAEQLELLIPLFSPSEVEEHISPIAMVLVHDKVSAVRETITRVLAAILLALVRSEKPQLASGLLRCVTESLARETLWVHRQTFASLCLRLYEVGAVDEAGFCSELLPELLGLASDPVPNVRLVVARTLQAIVAASPSSARDISVNPHAERLAEVEKALEEDQDVDVRYIYTGEPEGGGGGGGGEGAAHEAEAEAEGVDYEDTGAAIAASTMFLSPLVRLD